MSFLDKLPGQIAAALASQLHPGSLYVKERVGEDQYGNAIFASKPTKHPIRGIIESFTTYMARSRNSGAAVESGDMAVRFLLHGVPVDPSPGDHVSIDGPRGKGIRYRVVEVAEIDPARASCVVQCRET